MVVKDLNFQFEGEGFKSSQLQPTIILVLLMWSLTLNEFCFYFK
jgi:hypothetical protein